MALSPKTHDCARCSEHQVVVLIRFGIPVYQACKNSLIKQLNIMSNYGGRCVGIAHCSQIKVLQGNWPTDKALAMLVFPSISLAKRWESSSPELRQGDWLGGVDFILSPCITAPMASNPVFQIMSFEGNTNAPGMDPDSPLAKQMPELMQQYGVVPTVASRRVDRMRGHWNANYVVVNEYPSIEKFQAFESLEPIRALRETRNTAGFCTMVVCQLHTLTTP